MISRIRLFEEDNDLKILFKVLQNEGITPENIVHDALKHYLDEDPNVLRTIDLAGDSTLPNVEIAIEIINRDHRHYLRTHGRYNNGTHIIKTALRTAYAFFDSSLMDTSFSTTSHDKEDLHHLIAATSSDSNCDSEVFDKQESPLLEDSFLTHLSECDQTLLKENFMDVLRTIRKTIPVSQLSALEFINVFLEFIQTGTVSIIHAEPTKGSLIELGNVFDKGLFVTTETESLSSIANLAEQKNTHPLNEPHPTCNNDLKSKTEAQDKPNENLTNVCLIENDELTSLPNDEMDSSLITNTEELVEQPIVQIVPNTLFNPYMIFLPD